MDTDLHPLVDTLASNIDDAEESLASLINTALSASTSKLPLLDKAKLYTLVTYAIESLLFSYLRLNGLDAKTHPVFAELTRVKQYFEKIKTAETSHVKRNATLDKAAAGRFIKQGLAGNDEYDRKRAEQQEKEKNGAKRKFEDMTERVGSHSRFEAMSRSAAVSLRSTASRYCSTASMIARLALVSGIFVPGMVCALDAHPHSTASDKSKTSRFMVCT